MTQAILERYRCPAEFVQSRLIAPLSGIDRFFHLDADILCYGQCSSGTHVSARGLSHPHLIDPIAFDRGELLLSFDPSQVIDNLRHERYVYPNGPVWANPPSLAMDLYYSIRPLLPTSLRSRLQRIYFRDSEQISFPHWPIDCTVERLFEKLLFSFLKATDIKAIPFIWFWPDGARSAVMMTHDVETARGRDHCTQLMDINESFGIHASFQIVPEKRYGVPPAFLNEIRSRGNEINIQDLNHDGRLFHDRTIFESRVKAINRYGRAFEAKGFRAAVLYRNLDWFDALEFEYDMSVPNVGHLEAQRGGCCTVFPYFIGSLLELPVTTTQDYSLFRIFRQYNLNLWKAQAAGVASKHGLVSFITHPDYLQEPRAQSTYRDLLSFVCQCRAEQGMWITTPGEVNQWWRERSQMKLVRYGDTWRIDGPGKERARIAYARTEDDTLVYSRDGSRSEMLNARARS